MTTTLNLPDELVAQLRQRAARDGRTFEEVAAGLLAAAVARPAAASAELVPKRLPLIKARPAELAARPASAQEFADLVKAADLQDELERYERVFGHQYLDRALP